MPELNIFALGTNLEHTVDYICDRKPYFNEWLITCFVTPFEALTINGIEQGQPGDIMVNDPSFPKYHRSAKDAEIGFINSYIYCKGSLIYNIAKKFEIPLNTIIKSNNQRFFNKIITQIKLNLDLKPDFYSEENELNFQSLLLNISREALLYRNRYSKETMHREMLMGVRNNMLAEYSRSWSIKDLAKLAKLSIPRFTSLYKKTFNISPVNDLINKRINEAQMMLITSNMTIEQIALECGFSSIFYFSRIYKKRIGVSPKNIRN